MPVESGGHAAGSAVAPWHFAHFGCFGYRMVPCGTVWYGVVPPALAGENNPSTFRYTLNLQRLKPPVPLLLHHQFSRSAVGIEQVNTRRQTLQ